MPPLVLVISFVSLGDSLAKRPPRRLRHLAAAGAPVAHPALETGRSSLQHVGVFLLVLLLWAGFFGDQTVPENIVPTFVYVVFWVGLVLASVLFGDVFYRSTPGGRSAGRSPGPRRRRSARRPARDFRTRRGSATGRRPRASSRSPGSSCSSRTGTSPRTIAAAALAYSSVTFLGMGIFGVEPWVRRGEAFSVYFGLFARMSPVERRERGPHRRCARRSSGSPR